MGRGWERVSLVWLVTYLVDIGMRLGGWVPCLKEIGLRLGGWGERFSGRGPCRMGIRLSGRVPCLGLVCSASPPGGAAGEDRKGVSAEVRRLKEIEEACKTRVVEEMACE